MECQFADGCSARGFGCENCGNKYFSSYAKMLDKLWGNNIVETTHNETEETCDNENKE